MRRTLPRFARNIGKSSQGIIPYENFIRIRKEIDKLSTMFHEKVDEIDMIDEYKKWNGDLCMVQK